MNRRGFMGRVLGGLAAAFVRQPSDVQRLVPGRLPTPVRYLSKAELTEKMQAIQKVFSVPVGDLSRFTVRMPVAAGIQAGDRLAVDVNGFLSKARVVGVHCIDPVVGHAITGRAGDGHAIVELCDEPTVCPAESEASVEDDDKECETCGGSGEVCSECNEPDFACECDDAYETVRCPDCG